MKLEYLVKDLAGDLPLHPIRLTLDTVDTIQIEAIHKRLNIPLIQFNRYLYFTTEQQATVFLLAYKPHNENW